MNKKLPERPDLEQLKKQAKELLKEIRAGQTEALARVPQNEIARFALTDAQRIIAREYGFPSWIKFRESVELGGPVKQAAGVLIRAALSGQAEKVAAILGQYPRLSRASIQIAAVLGDPDGVRAWIRHDPALAAKGGDEKHWTPLLGACVGRVGGDDASRAECVRQLLAAGANPNDYWINDTDPGAKLPALYGATGINNYPGVARVLLAAGAEPNDGESIYHAAEHHHIASLQALREGGADLSQRHAKWKNTPLYFLVGHVPTTKHATAARSGIVWLLEHGANPNIPAYDYAEVPLFGVIRNGWDLELAEVFLRHGADAGARRADGLTLLAFATRHGREDIAADLVQHGASRSTVAPLDEFLGALARSDPDRARVLLGQNPSWQNGEPVAIASVLFAAAKRGDIGPINTAVALGLETNRVDEKSETPLHYAAIHGRLAAVGRLLELGADVRVRDRGYNATPLGWCVHGSIHFRSVGGDYPAVAVALLAAGAEMIPIPREQMSAEMLAVFDRYPKN